MEKFERQIYKYSHDFGYGALDVLKSSVKRLLIAEVPSLITILIAVLAYWVVRDADQVSCRRAPESPVPRSTVPSYLFFFFE